jgi:hypothetical protein
MQNNPTCLIQMLMVYIQENQKESLCLGNTENFKFGGQF